MSGKCTRGKCPGGMSVTGGQCPFPSVSCGQEKSSTVAGRPSVLHLRLSSASWLNAQSLLHIGHCDEKMCGLNKQKLVAMATSLQRLQPNFTAIIYARNDTNSENFANIGRVQSEIVTRSSAIAE